MSGYEAERAAIEARWATLWVEGSPAAARTPTRYETVPFTPPVSDPWAALYIVNGEADQVSMGDPGNNVFRHAGTVMVQIFAPLAPQAGSVATRRAEALADHAAAIFRAQRVDGLLFGAPYVSGRSEDDPWFHVTVTIPFTRDAAF